MGAAGIVRARTAGVEEVVASLLRQFSAHHGVDARYVGQHAVRDRTVLEFRATNKEDAPLHVVVDGSGPGRSAWIVGASSAAQAVEASEWNASVRAEAERSPEPQALLARPTKLLSGGVEDFDIDPDDGED